MNTEMHKAAEFRESFESLANRYRRQLYLYSLQILHNPEDAEEAVQDAFMRAYRALRKGGAAPLDNARLRAWLFKITLNVVRNRMRRKQHPQVSIDELESDSRQRALEDRSSPDVVLDRHTTCALVERAIRKLPSHLLEVARLRFIEGLTHSEISEQCARPVGTIKSYVFRAKQVLREVLEPALGM